jgi:uroporphyrinogen-III decarboxylase
VEVKSSKTIIRSEIIIGLRVSENLQYYQEVREMLSKFTDRRKIEDLIERVIDVINTPKNQKKRAVYNPKFTISFENISLRDILDIGDYSNYLEDPYLILELQLRQKLYHFEHFDDDTYIDDIVIIPFEHYFEYSLFGIDLRYDDRGCPIFGNSPLKGEKTVNKLTPHNFYTTGEMPRILRIYETIREIVKDRLRINLRLWERGGLDIAIQLLGYENFIVNTLENPNFIHELMNYIVDERIRWFEAYYNYSGVEKGPVGISDDWLNIPFITPEIFRDFVLPYYLKIEKYHGGITNIHTCGNMEQLITYWLEIKSLNNFEISPWSNLERSVSKIPSDKSLSIALKNSDVLLGTEETIRSKLREIIDICKGRKFSINVKGLQKMHDDVKEDIMQVKMFINIAREELKNYVQYGF